MKDESKKPLLGLSLEELNEELRPFVDRPFRVRQVFQGLYESSWSSLAEFSTLPKQLREALAEKFRVGRLEVVAKEESSDGTEKFLFRLEDDATIEAVIIPDGLRRTLCLSSQAGCALACHFCVTGYWGGGRDLSRSEIVAQVLTMLGTLEKQESLNVVFMGMGEPLLNPVVVRESIELLSQWISPRRMTLSTVGIIPGIEAMMSWEIRPNLAVSIHAADPKKRASIMPVEKKHPLGELMKVLRRYPLERGRQITVEYIMIRGMNDTIADADALVHLLRSIDAKVNLIPVNPDPVLASTMVPSSSKVIQEFTHRLRTQGLTVTERKRRGDGVRAACGQLRAPGRTPRGFRSG